MAEEIGIIKRALQEELTAAQDKLFKRYDQAVKLKLVEAHEVGQAAAESLIGGLGGLVSSRLAAASVLWLRKKGFTLIGSRAADFWAGLANLGLGTGAFLLNAAVPTGPIPGGLRQGIRTGSSVTFFMGLNETADALADYFIKRAREQQAVLAEMQKQKEQQQQLAQQPAQAGAKK